MLKTMYIQYPSPVVGTAQSISDLVKRTGYQIVQENGQRIYSHPKHANFVAPRGSEIFLGRLPRDVLEDEIVPICENAGAIFKLRLMMDFSGKNRGYCFVTYFNKQAVQTAIEMLNGHEIRPGCRIGVFKSLDNTRLFVGGIPEDKTRNDVLAAFTELVDGIANVIMYPSNTNQAVNRGYVFIEFESHRFAAIARRRLQPGSLILWNSAIMVDWAEPLPEPDPLIMSKVTKLYCRNISLSITSDQLRFELEKFIAMQSVFKVHKMQDFAFLHFTSRETAEEALQKLTGATIDGRQLEVMWARPECYSNIYRRRMQPNHFCLSIPAKLRRLIKMRQNLPGGNSNISPRNAMQNNLLVPMQNPAMQIPMHFNALQPTPIMLPPNYIPGYTPNGPYN